MKRALFVICVIGFGLTGCAVGPDRQTNRVIISGVLDGLHCPAGQAQKGRC